MKAHLVLMRHLQLPQALRQFSVDLAEPHRLREYEEPFIMETYDCIHPTHCSRTQLLPMSDKTYFGESLAMGSSYMWLARVAADYCTGSNDICKT